MAYFSERISIDENQPLPDYDTGTAKAYAVQSRAPGANQLMAYVVHGHLPTRMGMLSGFHGLSHPSLSLVHEAHVIDWPLTGQRHMAVIYNMMKGRRLAPLGSEGELHGSFAPIKEAHIIDHFIKPLGQAVCQIAKMGLYHGSIRADNVFVGDGTVMLGECLTAPCCYRQPAQYETPGRALAPDIARGPGTVSDDFYAFGVLVLTALTGDIPMRDLSPDAIVQMKIERGSYAALAGERRFGQATIELLRGLLTDDSHLRWTVDDFEHWLAGRRLTPRQSTIGKKANRPLKFGDVDYVQMRQFLIAMSQDTKLGAAMITNQEITRWISHGFSDDKALGNLEKAVGVTRQQRFGPEEERLVSNVQIALDPQAPIRYRGIRVYPQGIPTLLAQMMLTEAQLTTLAEIILNRLPGCWLDFQTEARHGDVIVAVQHCEKAVDGLQNKALGFGLERFLYDTNPSLPCLNPQLRERYALNPRQLLEAMERRAPLGGLQLIDRHIAAFLMSRDKNVSVALMANIDQMRELTRRNVGILNLYSNLQEQHGPEQLKNLAAILLPLTEEAVKRFHNRPRQERVRKELKAAAATGRLVNMLNLVDDMDTVVIDAQEFIAAKMLYRETEEEAERLASYAKDKKMLAEQAGQPLAAVVSVGLSFLSLLVIFLRMFQ